MAKKVFVYVGTYTVRFGTNRLSDTKSEGIYVFHLDLQTGSMNLIDKVEAVNPSYLTLDSRRCFLYAVNEVDEFQGQESGAASVFKVESDSGKLTFVNQKATLGADPCHIVVNDLNTHVFVSNYSSGSVCVFPIANGGLGDAVQLIRHEGSGVHPKRQTRPHAHSSVLDRANKYVLVPDLGTDKVMIYRFNRKALQPLEPSRISFTKMHPGAGPRHGVFHPAGEHFYVINELDSSISACTYHKDQGTLSLIHTVPTAPDGAEVSNTTADIHITPDGRFVYGSNRGHDSIAIYSVDKNTGRLECIGFQKTGGRTPRGFAIEPTGSLMLVGNQDTDNITIFRIDRNTGRLEQISETKVPTPVCVRPYLWG